MEWRTHSDAVEEFLDLPDGDRKVVEERIEARKDRDNPILDQRGVGIS